MRLTFNSDDVQHVQRDGGDPVNCGQDPTAALYQDEFASASALLDEMDMRTHHCAWAACRQCRSTVLELARQEESFWLPGLPTLVGSA